MQIIWWFLGIAMAVWLASGPSFGSEVMPSLDLEHEMMATTMPTFGLEATFTNPLFRSMADRGPLSAFLAGAARAELERDASLLDHNLRKYWTLELDFFAGLSSAFSDFSRNSEDITFNVDSHKGLPAFRIDVNEIFFARWQLEWQAIEVQSLPQTLLSFFLVAPVLQEVIWDNMNRIGLDPHLKVGMGHVHQGIASSFPKTLQGLRHLRNHLVHWLNNEQFWPTVGANVEAGLVWEEQPEGAVAFQNFLENYFDHWLANLQTGSFSWLPQVDAAFEDRMSFKAVFGYDPKEDFEKAWQIPWQKVRKVSDPTSLHSEIVKHLYVSLVLAFFRNIGGGKALVFNIRNFTLEHRRIPAYASADEAAMWIAFLHRHWQYSRQLDKLLPVVRPKILRGSGAVRKFQEMLDIARLHPDDFKKFLPGHLRVLPYPLSPKSRRWSEVRLELLENAKCMAAFLSR